MILKGRVGCYDPTKICFKTFVAGSHLGEFEIFMQSVRLFSVIAHTRCLILSIREDHLKTVLGQYPGAFKSVIERSLQRIISSEISLKKISQFKGLRASDVFWKQKFATGIDRHTPDEVLSPGTESNTLKRLVSNILQVFERKKLIGSLDL